jgi:glutamyl-Q tRNA(Asp) synthetase
VAATDQALTREARPYVGRFAPSPTGPLHFGSLVAAMASYADARAVGGRWLLRVEDVDQPRCSAEAEARIHAQLAAYGFEHDGEVVRQSERTALYSEALRTLTHAGDVFVCQCTRAQLSLAARNAEHEVIYPGTCRELQLADGAARALRLSVSGEPDNISFNDRCHGLTLQNLRREVGDFVLRRADGLFAYQLAVVVDDALQGVTDVVRGADLLGNTARQIVLQQRLGYPTPRYLHVPIARNTNGEKLSKQTRAAAIDEDRALPTLVQAWQFLKQADLGKVRTIADFWARAVSTWTPERLSH